MISKKFRQSIFILVLIGLLLSNTLAAYADSQIENGKAVIYYNEACAGCTKYINEKVIPLLEEEGIEEIIKKDYINDKNNRLELNELNEQLGIHPKLQGHFSIFIGNKIILQGHVPEGIIRDLLKEENQEIFERILVLQDEMHDAKSYKVWAFKGEIKEYQIDAPISEYLTWFKENKESLKTPLELQNRDWNFATLFPLVLATGLLDGINPCAFAVLLFFIAFLFTIKKTKASIFKMGTVYIFAIYLIYFLIGIGLFKAILITGTPHLMAKIGAYLVIFLGLVNIKNYLFPDTPLILRLPRFSKEHIKTWIHKATLPAAFVSGILVGLCTFPCSGGIYVAIVGLLASKATYFTGISYLLIYNVMFVVPLVAILIAASNKVATRKLTEWEQSKSNVMHLMSGIIMIALGLIILIWFV